MSDNTPEVQIALIEQELISLKKEVHGLSNEVAGLVDAWKTASGVVAFIKWLSGVIIAVGVIWTAIKLKIGG